MLKTMFTILVVAATLAFPVSAAADMNVEEWVATCEAKGGDKICGAYTSGVRDVLDLTKYKSACIPKYLTLRAVHETVMSVLRALARSDEHKTLGGRLAHVEAMIASYPCKDLDPL